MQFLGGLTTLWPFSFAWAPAGRSGGGQGHPQLRGCGSRSGEGGAGQLEREARVQKGPGTGIWAGLGEVGVGGG